MSKIKIIGHRGYGPTGNGDNQVKYPENTIVSFKYALDGGADGIELDVFLSKDGVPIVIHDRRLHEHVIPNQIGKVQGRETTDFTFEELQEFDVGAGEKIPSLYEVLALVDQYEEPKIINLDVKDQDAILAILKAVKKYDNEDFKHDVIISSYNWDILRKFRQNSPDINLVPAIKTAMLFGKENVGPGYVPLTDTYQEGFELDVIALHQEINCYAFDCAIPDFTHDLINFAKNFKVGLQLSTGNERVSSENTNYRILKQLEESLDIGVPFVICKVDEPDLVKGVMNKKVQAYSFV